MLEHIIVDVWYKSERSDGNGNRKVVPTCRRVKKLFVFRNLLYSKLSSFVMYFSYQEAIAAVGGLFAAYPVEHNRDGDDGTET